MLTTVVSRRLAALMLVAGLAVAVGVLAISYSTSSADVVLVGVSADDLEEIGLQLTPAESEAVAAVTAGDAEAEAARQRSGAVSRQTILARLSGRPSASNRLVWVVNVDPSSVAGAIPGGGINLDDPNAVTRYAGLIMCDEFLLIFFDAETGAFIFSREQSGEWIPAPTRADDGKPTPKATTPAPTP